MDNEQDIFNSAEADERRPKTTASYDDDAIMSLSWYEHIQQRPGMYIGKLGDGTNSDDGIYVLLKEVIDNSIDEYMMGYGNRPRLWPWHTSWLGGRCGIEDEYRRQV